MIRIALFFIVLSLVAGLFGFNWIAATAWNIGAIFLFVVIVFILFLFFFGD